MINYKEILDKPEISQQEMEFLVEEYIFEKKGRRVKIRIDLIDPLYFSIQMSLLQKAFWVAYEYFQNKNRD